MSKLNDLNIDLNDNWVISRTYNNQCNIIYECLNPDCLNNDIFKIRKIFAQFAEMPIQLVREKISNSLPYDFGSYGSIGAQRIIHESKLQNLILKIEDTSYISDLIINKTTNHAWLIENESENAKIVQLLIEKGCKIEVSESD